MHIIHITSEIQFLALVQIRKNARCFFNIFIIQAKTINCLFFRIVSFRFNGNYDTGIHLFCPEPHMKPKLFNVITPFPPVIWIILLVTLVAVTLVTAAIQRVQNIITDNSSHHSSFFLLFGIIFADCRYMYNIKFYLFNEYH